MEPIARKIQAIIDPQPVVEGAGVRLKRSIATRTLNYLDPFLLFDHFGSSRREDYEAGFPMHPHRGIETVTYMLSGEVQHRDTLGNSGSIGANDVQWMTSGRGIMHEEMPQVRPEGIDGFQLWVNLPAKQKMRTPRYQDVRAPKIPVIETGDGARIRIVAGNIQGVSGAVTDIEADPTFVDIFVPANSSINQPIPRGHNAFAYLFEGEASFEDTKVSKTRMIILSDGDFLRVTTGPQNARFLLVSGKPLNEPVARYGPFVMNTKEEIEKALEDLRRGTFVQPL